MKLLSEEEIKEKLNHILGDEDYKYTSKPFHLMELINSQKIAHGEYVIGKDDSLAGFTYADEADRIMSNDDFNHEERNELRAEQRERNTL